MPRARSAADDECRSSAAVEPDVEASRHRECGLPFLERRRVPCDLGQHICTDVPRDEYEDRQEMPDKRELTDIRVREEDR
jgi:hypothetical protein